MPPSAPCRKVSLVLEQLDLTYEYKMTNPMTGDTRTPEFLKVRTDHAHRSDNTTFPVVLWMTAPAMLENH